MKSIVNLKCFSTVSISPLDTFTRMIQVEDIERVFELQTNTTGSLREKKMKLLVQNKL